MSTNHGTALYRPRASRLLISTFAIVNGSMLHINQGTSTFEAQNSRLLKNIMRSGRSGQAVQMRAPIPPSIPVPSRARYSELFFCDWAKLRTILGNITAANGVE